MATTTIRTNSNNDLFLPDGRNLDIIQNIEACAQDTRSKVLMRKGEDIYDVNAGVDYFGEIFTPQPNYDGARRSIIRAITSSPDIVSIESLEVQVGSGVFAYEALIVTLHGRTRISNNET